MVFDGTFGCDVTAPRTYISYLGQNTAMYVDGTGCWKRWRTAEDPDQYLRSFPSKTDAFQRAEGETAPAALLNPVIRSKTLV